MPAPRELFYGHGDEIGRVQKNALDVIRVALCIFNGREYIDIRVWTLNRDGEIRPTKAGVAIAPALLDEVIDLLQLAAQTAYQAGWFGDPEPEPLPQEPESATMPGHDESKPDVGPAGDPAGQG